MIPQLFVVSLLLFILAQFMPGDPLRGRLDPTISNAGEKLAQMREAAGLNDPWYVQYTRWIGGALRGDLGMSYRFQIPVAELIVQRAGNTFLLSLFTAVLLYMLAVPLGMIAGRNPGTVRDRSIMIYSYIAFSMPSLVFGLINIFVFAYRLRWFPSGGSVDVMIDPGTFAYYIDRIYRLMLPAMTLALISTTGIIHYLRNEIINYSNCDFALTARSKGVPENRVYSRHILRNSLLPIASGFGFTITGLFSGAIFAERIFSYPGMGNLFLTAIVGRDYGVVNSIVLFNSALFIVGGLLSDIIMTIVDPRIRIK
jgi:peptide/nickel transport system permease protein